MRWGKREKKRERAEMQGETDGTVGVVIGKGSVVMVYCSKAGTTAARRRVRLAVWLAWPGFGDAITEEREEGMAVT